MKTQMVNSLISAPIVSEADIISERERFFEEIAFGNEDLDSIHPESLESYGIPLLVEYLTESHTDFLYRRLPKIFGTASQLVKNIDESHTNQMATILLNQFSSEMENHFQYEEMNLFPYAMRLNQGEFPEDYSTKIFEESHPEFIVDINKLICFFDQYQFELDGFFSYRILMNELKDFERALNLHGIVEDQVLIPKLAKLEARLL